MVLINGGYAHQCTCIHFSSNTFKDSKTLITKWQLTLVRIKSPKTASKLGKAKATHLKLPNLIYNWDIVRFVDMVRSKGLEKARVDVRQFLNSCWLYRELISSTVSRRKFSRSPDKLYFSTSPNYTKMCLLNLSEWMVSANWVPMYYTLVSAEDLSRVSS